jgi:hypothetical protein
MRDSRLFTLSFLNVRKMLNNTLRKLASFLFVSLQPVNAI